MKEKRLVDLILLKNLMNRLKNEQWKVKKKAVS